jgi:hypothetical protein
LGFTLRQAQQATAFLGLTAAIIYVVHIIFSCTKDTIKAEMYEAMFSIYSTTNERDVMQFTLLRKYEDTGRIGLLLLPYGTVL